ncbi:MAG: hypothetical protein MUO59_04295 [Actinobacteria bacterium]|nr:hypothetical protein [Actinomycetota bacterium]
MERIGNPGGLFAIFRVIQYIPYIAIGLMVMMIALWIVFGIKKLRWAKILAIILTVLVVITGLLGFTPYIIGAVTGRQSPMRGFTGGRDFPAGDRERFKDFRERHENENSGLDIDDYGPSVDFVNELVAI